MDAARQRAIAIEFHDGLARAAVIIEAPSHI